MRCLRVSLVTLVVFATLYSAKPSVAHPDQMFDQYGNIRWNDEKARLDNFAIQLMHESDLLGYIFVHDGKDMCSGEAQARAMRAKRYVVETRNVPWNRVIWRIEGYTDGFSTILQPVSRGVVFNYPFGWRARVSPEIHSTKGCAARLARIRRDK
jgi:hypothetical protein